jgi:hypothetical protein
MITKGECLDMEAQGTEIEFYEGYLCSSENLSTNCGPSEQTTCVEGKDQVYFLDTCGNIANIYDANKIENKEYWSKIKGVEESCNSNANNYDSCGNCDFFQGSTCKKYEAGKDTNPDYGDYVCRNLDCEWNDEEYKHGETWCALSGSTTVIDYQTHLDQDETESEIKEMISEHNVPGSRYFRLLCYNGDVLIEPCADYRQEVCIQDQADTDEGIFRYGACVVNKWQDCLLQEDEKDCENADRRDCVWLDSGYFSELNNNELKVIDDDDVDGICIPKFTPGFDFWQNSSDNEDVCGVADRQCVVKYERGYGSNLLSLAKEDWNFNKNEECHPDGSGHETWLDERNMVCMALGDCGVGIDYLDKEGYYEEDDVLDVSKRLDEDELEEELED